LETPTAWFPSDFFNEYHEIMGKKTQRIDGEIMRKHKTTMIFGMRSWWVAQSKIMLVIPWCAYYPLVTASHFLPGHLEKRKPPAIQALSFDCWYSTATYIQTLCYQDATSPFSAEAWAGDNFSYQYNHTCIWACICGQIEKKIL
jgi:hypothetical protein